MARAGRGRFRLSWVAAAWETGGWVRAAPLASSALRRCGRRTQAPTVAAGDSDPNRCGPLEPGAGSPTGKRPPGPDRRPASDPRGWILEGNVTTNRPPADLGDISPWAGLMCTTLPRRGMFVTFSTGGGAPAPPVAGRARGRRRWPNSRHRAHERPSRRSPRPNAPRGPGTAGDPLGPAGAVRPADPRRPFPSKPIPQATRHPRPAA